MSAMTSLKPPTPVGVGRQDLHAPALAFRISGIHAEDIRHEERGFVAAGSCPDFENDVAFVVGILRQKQKLEVCRRSAAQALLEVCQFLLGHRFHVGVQACLAKHGPGFADAPFEILVLAVLGHNFAEIAVGFGGLLVPLAVGDDFRIGELTRSDPRSELRRSEAFRSADCRGSYRQRFFECADRDLELRVVRFLGRDLLEQQPGIGHQAQQAAGMFCGDSG